MCSNCFRLYAARISPHHVASTQRRVQVFCSESGQGSAPDENKAFRFRKSNRRKPVVSDGDSKNLITAMSGEHHPHACDERLPPIASHLRKLCRAL
jgi:hypothetical protein